MIGTYYERLQIEEDASPEAIRAAYKYLSQKWHPDMNPENPELALRNLQAINRAYEVLSNPVSRVKHDRWIEDRKQRQFGRRATDVGRRASDVDPSAIREGDRRRRPRNSAESWHSDGEGEAEPKQQSDLWN